MKTALQNKFLLFATIMVALIHFASAQSISYSSSFDLSAGFTLNTSYNVIDEQPLLQGVTFSPNGMKMYTVGSSDDEINQYSLSTAFDLNSTITHQGAFSVAAQATQPSDIVFSSDGMTMFTIDSKTVEQFALTSAFDITQTVNFITAITTGSGTYAITFSSDGKKLFVAKSTGNISQYSLTSAYDVGAVTLDGNSEIFLSYPTGISFNADGTKLFAVTSGTDKITQHSLSVPYDVLSEITSNEVVLSLTDPNGIVFSPDGTKLFISNNSKNIVQYDLNPPLFRESIANDGVIIGSVTSFTLTGETFTNQASTLTFNTDYQVSNLPTGLTPVLEVASDGINATLSFTGSATNNQNSDDVSSLTFNFLNSAFTGGDASAVSGAQSASTGISLDFRENQTPIVAYGRPIISVDNIQTTTFSVAGQETTPSAMAFDNTGTKLFVAGYDNSTIYEYNLTTPYEITSGVSPSGNTYDVSAEETQPQGIQFNSNGTKMFVLGASGDDVNQYSLSSPYDITSIVAHQGSYSISSQTSAPEGLYFSPNGENMYVADYSNTYMYRLSSPFDVTSGVIYDVSFDRGGRDLIFSVGGEELYLNNGSGITVFELEIPYFIGYGVSEVDYAPHNSVENQVSAFFISPDRSHLLLLGNTGDDITQVNLPVETFSETFVDDGSLTGTISLTIVDDLFTNAGGTLQEGVHYTLIGLPAGLTSILNVDSDGLSADFSLSGQATNNDRVDNVYDIQFTFNDNAFVNSSASQVTNAIGANSYFAIAFREVNGIISTPGGYDLSQLSYSGTTFDISSDEATATGLAFSNDGSKLFICGQDGEDITIYDLNTPFDVSAVTLAGVYDVSSETTNAYDIAFNSDGTKMYIVGSGIIFQYSLTNPFDLSTDVSLDGSKALASAYKIAFSPDGSRLIKMTTSQYFQYELTTPFDITAEIAETGSTFHSLSIPGGIAFSPDGNTLFAIYGQNDRIYKQILTSPFDITGGVSNSTSFYVGSQELQPLDLVFSPDGSRMFVVGASDEINQYEISLNGFTESATNDGSVSGSFAFNLNGDVFTHANGSLTQDSDYSITGLPSGLSSVINISSDGLTGTLSFSGNADDHQNADDVSSLVINFLDGAFASSDASTIINGNFVINTGINFVDNGTLVYDGRLFESYNNDGSVGGSIEITITNETFTNAGSTLTSGVDYSIAGVPSGLTPELVVAGDGLSAVLTFSGSVSAHQNINDVADLVFTFENSAFTISAASDVFNAINYSNAIGIDFKDNSPSITYGSTFDLAGNKPSMVASFDISSQDDSPGGMAFSNDGMKMFYVGYENSQVFEYHLVTAFDVSSGVTYSGNSFDISEEVSSPSDLVFNLDGTVMYVVDGSGDEIEQYSLSAEFDISSTVVHQGKYQLNAQDIQPSAITFSPNGKKMYMIGSSNDKIFQYTLAIPFDVTSDVSYDGIEAAVPGRNYSDIQLSEDGKKIFISNSAFPGASYISQYDLSIPYDISGGISQSGNFYFHDIDYGPTDFAVSPDRKRLLVLGAQYDLVYQFDLSIDGFNEISLNNGEVEGMLSVEITDDQFTNSGGTMTYGSDYSISNLPTGLTATMNVAEDGYSAIVSLAGNAADHQDADDVVLEFTFNNSAFVTSEAVSVANAINASSERSVDFRDNHPILFYGNGLNMEYAKNAGDPLDVSNEEFYPAGMAFNNNGTKMFIVGGDNSAIHQYSLSTPYQITSGVTFDGSFDVSPEDEYPEDIVFSGDGSKMYVMGDDSYVIYEYNLSTAFEITTGVSYTGNSLDVNAYNGGYGMTLSSDGTKMYLIGDGIHQFALSTPFDVTNATFETTYSPDELEGLTDGVISPDGRYLLILSSGFAVSYILNTPFDISNGLSINGTPVNLSGEIGYASSLVIHPNGNRLFVVSGGEGNDASVHQYEMDLGSFTETSSNNGSVEGAAKIYLVDDTFVNAGGVLTHGVDYNINNLPSGLTATLDVAADGYSATVTLTGNSNVHGDINDIPGLQFHFQNSAFSNYSANEVDNATNYTTNIGIDYLPYTENDISTFTFVEINGPELIFTGTHKVTAEAVAGTDLSAITPTITISREASISPDTGVEQDFTSAVIYTVTAEDGTEQDWEVSITEKLVVPTDILLSNNIIDENASSGILVGTLSTIDASFADAHTYTFVSGTNDNELFDIINGNELVTTESLDYENSPEWLVDVMTDDGNGGTFTKQLTINLNDVNEIPTDIQLSNNTVNESSSTGTVVGSLTTIDEDSGDAYVYSLKAGNTDNDAFDIDGDQLVTAEVLDFETKSVYNLELITTDQGGLTHEKAFVINVNDLPAQITSIELSSTQVSENTGIGTLVGTFATFGEGLSGNFTYDIIPGSGDNDHTSFTISGDQLLVDSNFDFETKDSYTIVVMSDDGNLADEQEFTISVTDVPEAPTDILLSVNEVAENNDIGEIIGLFTTTDQDAGESYTYVLTTGDGDTDNASFSINENELKAAAVYDFEAQSSYSIRVETNDGNGGTYQKAFTVTILNENESIIVANPIADQSLDEGFEITEIDLSTVFVDQDSDALTYEVSSTNTAAVTVSNTGAILTITEVGIGTSIVTVTADDGSGVTTSDEFSVVVNDVNEAPVVVNPIEDLPSVIEGFEDAQINYTGVFSDGDGDELTITVSSSDPGVVTVGLIANNQIHIDEVGLGTSTITLTANDGRGGSVSDEFIITVSKAPSTANDIVTFSVVGQIGESVIDEINHTIILTVSSSANISNLTPELSLSDLSTVSPVSGVARDFSSAVVYTVTAENGDTQDWTVTVDQMKSQTITIQSIGEKTYGSSSFALQAEATSQLEVSFELIDGGNAVTLQGSMITVRGAGSFIVKASQSGNAEYEEQSVQQTFSIQKALLTATADNKSRVFGGENPELTIQYSGFVNGDVQADLAEKPIASTSAVPTSNVGEYAIEVTGGSDANYEIQPANGVLTISKATATIALSDLEQDADGSVKTPTVTTDPAGLSHTITYDGLVDAPSEAGTYSVVVTIDEDNYEGERTASFTINGIATGLEDFALEYKVYPNPAKNWLKIENPGYEELTIRMYNLDGQLLLSDNLTLIHNNLDISSLNNGMYLLSLSTKQYSTTTRILINR
ncbi:cadherin domain-containing protein [Reichenbachiella sp. MALMAid0571]|uniref:cadherin domain-containing protein n=1 Tax=Reichenbachiella sp. MALMAid0571 TaxID=3143939 RepID=UPI0032E0572F